MQYVQRETPHHIAELDEQRNRKQRNSLRSRNFVRIPPREEAFACGKRLEQTRLRLAADRHLVIAPPVDVEPEPLHREEHDERRDADSGRE